MLNLNNRSDQNASFDITWNQIEILILTIISFYPFIHQDKANEALDFFDELVQIEVGIIVPYVKDLVQFCMQVDFYLTLISMFLN